MDEPVTESNAIEDRLLPLPRAVSCDGWWDIEPGELRVVCDGDHDTLRLAADELAEFLTGGGTTTPVTDGAGRPDPDALTLVVTSGASHALPAAGYQRYAIEPEARGLRLIGAEPVGAYYAVKTLKQLVERGDGRVRGPAPPTVNTVRTWVRGAETTPMSLTVAHGHADITAPG